MLRIPGYPEEISATLPAPGCKSSHFGDTFGVRWKNRIGLLIKLHSIESFFKFYYVFLEIPNVLSSISPETIPIHNSSKLHEKESEQGTCYLVYETLRKTSTSSVSFILSNLLIKDQLLIARLYRFCKVPSLAVVASKQCWGIAFPMIASKLRFFAKLSTPPSWRDATALTTGNTNPSEGAVLDRGSSLTLLIPECYTDGYSL